VTRRVWPSRPSLADPYSSSATGQAFEFRIWSELIQQSEGRLHVFLPLLDTGLDAVIHRLDDGAYIPVQLKSRTRLVRRRLLFVVVADSLVDDRALVIAGLLNEDGLGPYLLVVEEGTFRRLADRFGGEGPAGVEPPQLSRRFYRPLSSATCSVPTQTRPEGRS